MPSTVSHALSVACFFHTPSESFSQLTQHPLARLMYRKLAIVCSFTPSNLQECRRSSEGPMGDVVGAGVHNSFVTKTPRIASKKTCDVLIRDVFEAFSSRAQSMTGPLRQDGG